MGLWVQVDMGFPSSREAMDLAEAAELDLDAAVGKMVRFWGWCLDNAREGRVECRNPVWAVEEAARWRGPAGAFVAAAVAARLLEWDGPVLVVCGYSKRYLSMLGKLEVDAKRQAAYRAAKAQKDSCHADGGRDSPRDVTRDITRTSRVTSRVQTQTQTQIQKEEKEETLSAAKAAASVVVQETVPEALGDSPTDPTGIHSPGAKARLKRRGAEPLGALNELLEITNPRGKPIAVQAEEVFQHWRRVMKKTEHTAFDAKRRGAVEKRLREGYSVETLCLAVDGCARTPHNMGENERKEVFNDLELICRSAGQVDRFVGNARPPKASSTAPPASGCAACGATEGYIAAYWGQPLCARCANAWSAEVKPTTETGEAQTAAWVEARRLEARVAS